MYNSKTKEERSLIKEGDILTELHFSATERRATPSTGYYQVKKEEKSLVLSPCEGYVVYNPLSYFCDGKESLMAAIYPRYEDMLEIAYPFSYEIGVDSFTNSKTIKWTKLNGDNHGKSMRFVGSDTLRVSLSLINNSPAILFYYYYRTTRGTNLLLLFEDGTVIPYNFWGNQLQDNAHYILLDSNAFEKMRSCKITGIRIKKGEEITDYSVRDLESESFTRFVNIFSNALAECGITIPETLETEEEKVKKDESCWVYLMHDKSNNSYKIGISNKPEYRERTLQSEKPSIEKLAAKKYPSRTLARTIEVSLHKVYQDKHLRGEWFCLDEKEVSEVIQSLS